MEQYYYDLAKQRLPPDQYLAMIEPYAMPDWGKMFYATYASQFLFHFNNMTSAEGYQLAMESLDTIKQVISHFNQIHMFFKYIFRDYKYRTLFCYDLMLDNNKKRIDAYSASVDNMYQILISKAPLIGRAHCYSSGT